METHTPDSLLSAFDVMGRLLPNLTDAHSFAAQVARQHVEGYRLLTASDAGSVVGLAGYRTLTNRKRGTSNVLTGVLEILSQQGKMAE